MRVLERNSIPKGHLRQSPGARSGQNAVGRGTWNCGTPRWRLPNRGSLFSPARVLCPNPMRKTSHGEPPPGRSEDARGGSLSRGFSRS